MSRLRGFWVLDCHPLDVDDRCREIVEQGVGLPGALRCPMDQFDHRFDAWVLGDFGDGPALPSSESHPFRKRHVDADLALFSCDEESCSHGLFLAEGAGDFAILDDEGDGHGLGVRCGASDLGVDRVEAAGEHGAGCGRE